MKKIFVSLVIIFTAFFIKIEQAEAQSLSEFLTADAKEVTKESIQENLRFYLNRHYKKEKMHWFDGTIISKKGMKYEDLKIKFNIIDNSVNIKNGVKYYRIFSHSLNGFNLIDKNGMREFKRGYSESRIHTVKAFYNISTNEAMIHLMGFNEMESVKILKLEANKKMMTDGELFMEIISPSTKATYDLQAHILKREGFWNVQVETKGKGLDKSVFFEIIQTGNKASLLKYHTKKSTETENVSLADHSVQNTFDKSNYYLSDKDNNIRYFYLNKKSIKKALEFAGVKVPKKMPFIRNERKLVSFLRKII